MSTTNTTRTKYYLGIDPAAQSTGLALLTVQNGIPCAWDSIHVVPSKGLSGGARLTEIYTTTQRFLDDKGATTLAGGCMESASLFSTGRETVLSEVRGIFLLLAHLDRDCEPLMVPPAQLKKFATGSGGASKEEVLSAIQSSNTWNPANDDESDACALCNLAYALDCSDVAPLTRSQLELVNQLLQGKVHKTQLVKPRLAFGV